MPEEQLTTEEAMIELLKTFDKSLKKSTGMDMHEIVRMAVTNGWHVLPADPPAAGADVLLQYRTKAGDTRMVTARWTGSYWSGYPFQPQAWREPPEQYHPPVVEPEE